LIRQLATLDLRKLFRSASFCSAATTLSHIVTIETAAVAATIANNFKKNIGQLHLCKV
jgi:hypothetical protein